MHFKFMNIQDYPKIKKDKYKILSVKLRSFGFQYWRSFHFQNLNSREIAIFDQKQLTSQQFVFVQMTKSPIFFCLTPTLKYSWYK